MGTVGIAGLLAHVMFWVLLLIGWQDLWPRRTIVFALLWLAGYLLLPRLPHGELLFMPYVAALDVALALIVFYGDSKL